MEKKITINTLNKYEIVKENTEPLLLKKIVVKRDNPIKFTVTLKYNKPNGGTHTFPHSLLSYDFVPDKEPNTLVLDISKNSKFQTVDNSLIVEVMVTSSQTVDNLDIDLVYDLG